MEKSVDSGPIDEGDHELPFSVSIEKSSNSCFDGRGCDASSKSFADNLSVRASSIGPKTPFFSLTLLAFLLLDRELFAICNVEFNNVVQLVMVEIFELTCAIKSICVSSFCVRCKDWNLRELNNPSFGV